MSVIAIDPGIASTGYAIGEYPNKILEIGIIKTYKKDGSDFDRVLKIKEAIRDLIIKHQVTYMIVEDYVVYGNPITAVGKSRGEKTIKVITALEFLANEMHIDIEIVKHNSWKARSKKIWQIIAMSNKFPEIEKIYTELYKEKQDHKRDAFKMLIPEIISFTEVI